MKKLFSLFVITAMIAIFTQISFSQLTGTKNIPGDYGTLALAISDLNTQGVGAGGVTLNLVAGNPQTAPAGGYSITATGIAANQIIIQGNGNTITASSSLTVGALNDAIFKVIGADYVTITGFNMTENAANIVTVAASNNMTEWGVAVLYATATNGSQNITISSNTITLNRTYQNTFGIYSNSTHTATAISTSATATGANGGNHNLKIYSNSISNVNIGILVVGPTAAADMNTGIDIGGASVLQGNTLANYGTTGTFSGYVNVSGTVNGILVRNSTNFNISYNSVTSSNGGTTAGTLRGIYVPSFSIAPTGTFTQTINNNTISVRSAVATGAMMGISVETTTGTTTSTLNLNNNNFNTITHTVASSGAITLLINGMASLVQNINNNTFTNINCNTTGSFTFISNNVALPAGGSVTANNNSIVTGFNKTGAGGTVTLYLTTTTPSSAVGTTKSEQNNNFSNITLTGATTMSGWMDVEGATGGGSTKTINNNTFSNWTCGTSSVAVLQTNFSGNGTTVSNNTISNITMAPTATGTTLTGISIGSSNGGATQTISNNNISSLSSTGTGGQVIGILGGATGITTLNINGNIVSGISSTSTAGVVVAGIYNSTTGTTVNIFKNKVYDITCTQGAVMGIASNATGAANTINIYNNIIGRLYATATTFYQAARGLYLGSTVAATYNLYYNTVYLDGTTPTQTYCVYAGSTVANVPNVNAINNVFINKVTSSNGATLPNTVYFRFGVTNATNLASTTNNNILYCGSPDASHLMYVDGAVSALTNPKQTLADYQSFVSSRENLSKTESSPFLNTTTGSSANYLHIDPSVPTQIEGNGAVVAGITDDYDGDDRSTLTPIDIGADAGNFTSAGDITPPTITYTVLSNTTSTSNRSFTNVTITDLSGVQTASPRGPKVYYKRTTDGNVWNDNSNGTDGWKFAEANNASSPFDFTIDYSLLNGGSGVGAGDVVQYFVVAEDMAPTPNVGINSGTFASAPTTCNLDGSAFPIGGSINSYVIVGAPLSGTYTVGLSMMRPLTGKSLEFVTKTRKVKRTVPVEPQFRAGKEEKKGNTEISQVSSISSYADMTGIEMKEIETEETYSEIYENGTKYNGSLYAEYPQNRRSGNNTDNKSGGVNQPDLVGNYATITAALADLNNRGVSGAVTFLLIDANYAGETYPLQVNNNVSGVSVLNPVTIKPQSGVTATIPGSIASNAVFRILSNYVTVDGSNSGGTDRSLTVQNNSATSPVVFLVGSTGTTPITNVTIKNCVITNGANTSSAINISDATTIGSAGYFNTVTIQNNLIEKAYIGLYSTGGTATTNGFNLVVADNTLNSSGASSIRLVGLYAQYVNGATFSNNTISNIANTSDASSNIGGIWAASGCSNVTISGNNISNFSSTLNTSSYLTFGIFVTSGVANGNYNITGNTITGLTASTSATTSGIAVTGATSGITIQKNKISNTRQTSTTGWGTNGIYLGSSAVTGDITAKNNMIFDIAAYGYLSGSTVTDNGYGIIINAGTNHKIYNNTILMNTSQTVDGLPAAMNITTGVTTAAGTDIRNNVFVNTQTVGTNRYAIYSGAANTVYSNINYNSYYTSGPNVGNIASVTRATVADWRTGTGKDVQSFSRNPLFTSSTDLHIQTSDLSVSGRGNFIAAVTDDFDGNSRPTTQSTSVKPVDVGCDQYTPVSYTGNVCLPSGQIYFDGGLKAIEVTSGAFTTSQVRQFTGVRTPNNTLFKNGNSPVKQNDSKKNNGVQDKKNVKKDGTSGGQQSLTAVNVPWVYWEIADMVPTTEPITLRFYYNDDQLATISEAALKLSYWNGTTWDNSFTQSVDGTNNYIQITLPAGGSWGSTALFSMEDNGSPLPVVLASFDAAVNNRDVSLNWVTESELNNRGFSVEKRIKTVEGQYSGWKEVTFINGKGNSNVRVSYSFTDKKLNAGAYQYRLKQVDYNGNYEYHSPAGSNDMVIGKPGNFDISQNYPNPSNPKSKIDFQMPFDGKVSIKVYDILGQQAASLLDEYKTADFYTVEFDGSNLSSGTYFYRIIAEGNNQKFTKTLKMILVK